MQCVFSKTICAIALGAWLVFKSRETLNLKTMKLQNNVMFVIPLKNSKLQMSFSYNIILLNY